ncbi:Oligopeptide transport ATP-binding protein OppF [Geodia barretti]|uniref:Oligopeptide transport ATP-binding protein OppF n=1 Tax=Geodia barretti TaxID=519541 RepID=A0AA35RB61_GEOBA|nr:Oligopeptide transport ATP-binding protein OppF [Geodia barretti]
MGIVGESGCGKSITAKSILQIVEAPGRIINGEINYNPRPAANSTTDILSLGSNSAEMIFQDPFSSLNPRMNIYEIISEPLLVHGIGSSSEREDRVAELLRVVRLRPEYMRRYPHAFSGGQRQRIGIARALAVNPRLILADEPVSGLDVSVQAQVINLMMDLQDELGLTYLFVSHDLSVVKQISNRVVVMYVGRIAEIGTPEELFGAPKHPYTAALMSSVPKPHPSQRSKRYVLEGEVAKSG